jgi:regulator of protease activity HflC (stomatin/prohibitin superfamily)
MVAGYNLDTLLDTLSKISWVIFVLFVIIYFIRTAIKQGFVKALLSIFSVPVLSVLLVTLIITLISLALVFVEPENVAVVISLLSPGGMRPQPLLPGLHWIVPVLENEERYPGAWETYTMSSKPGEGQVAGDDSIRARTSDGQQVLLDCSVIFRVDPTQIIRIHVDWQHRDIEDFVRPVVRGYVRTQVSQFTVKEVNSDKRKDLEVALDRTLRDEFSNKGLILDQFILRDIAFSPEYANAVEQKQVALEGKQQKEYEAEQTRIVAKGRADAIRIEAQAQSEALGLIKTALDNNASLLNYSYIQKLSPSLKVMLLPSNNPLMLPLPNLESTSMLTPTDEITPTSEITSTLKTSTLITPANQEVPGP